MSMLVTANAEFRRGEALACNAGFGALPTMADALAAGDGVLLNEQAALLRECRLALDDLLRQKPMMTGLLCGSTTLGNLRAELYKYRPQGVFGGAPLTEKLRDAGVSTKHINGQFIEAPNAKVTGDAALSRRPRELPGSPPATNEGRD